MADLRIIYHGGDFQHARYGPDVGRVETDVGSDCCGRRDGRRRVGSRKSRFSHLDFV